MDYGLVFFPEVTLIMDLFLTNKQLFPSQGLLVDYCDVLSAVWSHSVGIPFLQIFSDEDTNLSTSWMPEGK